jgi:hypothetical protein
MSNVTNWPVGLLRVHIPDAVDGIGIEAFSASCGSDATKGSIVGNQRAIVLMSVSTVRTFARTSVSAGLSLVAARNYRARRRKWPM